jgi:hypothetical protein
MGVELLCTGLAIGFLMEENKRNILQKLNSAVVYLSSTTDNKKCIYVVDIGGYDLFSMHLMPLCANVDIYFFTSTPALSSKEKNIFNVVINSDFFSNKELSRLVKMNPLAIFRGLYDAALYIDGNIEICSPGYIDGFLSLGESDIAIFEHPLRSSVRQELIECLLIGHFLFFDVLFSSVRLLTSKVQSLSLYECNVIYFNLRSNVLAEFSDVWFVSYFYGVKRDQLYFSDAVVRANVKVCSLGQSHMRDVGGVFALHHHKTSVVTQRMKFFRRINKLSLVVLNVFGFNSTFRS